MKSQTKLKAQPELTPAAVVAGSSTRVADAGG